MSMSNVKELNLHKTLPAYLRQDAFAVAFVKAVDEELQQIADEIKLVRLLENIDLQSDSTLDHLAKHFHVDFYDTTLRREQKSTSSATAIKHIFIRERRMQYAWHSIQ